MHKAMIEAERVLARCTSDPPAAERVGSMRLAVM